MQKCSTSRWTASWKCIASYGRVRPACRCGTVIGQLQSFRNRRQSNAEIGGNLFGLETLNREAQERWDDDGGAIPLELAIQNTDLEGLTTARTSVVGANDRLLLLNQLELANRCFAESETPHCAPTAPDFEVACKTPDHLFSRRVLAQSASIASHVPGGTQSTTTGAGDPRLDRGTIERIR